VILVGLKKETREDLRAAGVDVVDSIEGAKVIGALLYWGHLCLKLYYFSK